MGTFGNITSDSRQCAFPGGSTDIQTMALGGTGANLTAIAGGVVYSTATQLAITAAGTSTQVLHGNGTGAPTWGAVALTADVTGVLPVANGGTNKSSWTDGGVVFAGPAGATLEQTATTFFWDYVLGRLGIGNNTPQVLLDLGLVGTTAGVMRLAGLTSGNVTIQPAAAAGTWTLTLPITDGAANEFLKTDGAGVTSWSRVVLTTDVSGTLPVGNGGSGAATLTGILQGNGAGAFTASIGTLNMVPRWSATGLTATGSIFDNGTLVGIGTTSPNLRFSQKLDISAISGYGGIGLNTWAVSVDQSAIVDFNKSRNITVGNHTIVASGDVLGYIMWRGSDGVAFIASSYIRAVVDVTPGVNDMPGRLEFATTPAGSAAALVRLSVHNSGNIGFNTTTFGTSAAKVLAIGSGTAPTTSPADVVQMWSADRGGTAGKAALHLRTEDGTSHVFGDLSGFGTVTPSYKLQVNDSSANGRALQLLQTSTSGVNYGIVSQVTGASTENNGGFFQSEGAASNYGIKIASPNVGANNWALYASGTAKSHFAGSVGIGVVTGDASAKLQVDSTTSGILLPRMTKAQRDAIGTPANGLVLYQSDGTAGIKAYVGGAWYSLNATADP